MIGKFVIVKNLAFNEYMSDENGTCIYDTMQEAIEVCWIYEFETALVLEIKANYKENDNTTRH